MKPTRWRGAAIAIPVSVLVGSVLTGCGSSGPDYRGVCQDPITNRRIDDGRCDRGGGYVGGGRWVYFPRGATVVPIGSPMTGGVSSVPPGARSVRGGAPREGGVVTRGGFGGKGGKGVGG